jgi:hypothetical protein
MEFIGHGDIEADEEIAVAAVQTAAEFFAAIGEVHLASRLEAVRSRAIEGWPILPDDESLHEDWLRTNGVLTSSAPADVDLGVALDTVRTWLRDHRADPSASEESD